MVKSLLFILIILNLFSCGATTDEKLAEAILDAQIALGSSDCQHAINTLEAYGRVNTNSHYLKTLSSAYACRAGYSTPTFFSTDLALTATPPPLTGMALYTTSLVATTSPLQTDAKFEDLQTAIDILLYAGGFAKTKNPTTTERAKYFTADEAGDINTQLLFMELAQLGKFMRIYGNASSTAGLNGLKGTGTDITHTNLCFTSYANADAGVFGALQGVNKTCKVNNSSHTELAEGSVPDATRKTRLCHGVVLLNGVLDLLPSVVGAASGGSLAAVSGLTLAISAVKSAVSSADNTTTALMATMSQTQCEDPGVATIGNVETYYAGVMEYMFQ
jgi:hypothetical protein